MKKRNYVLLLAGAVCSFCMAGTTMAQEVVFSGKEKCPLTVVKDITGYESYLASLSGTAAADAGETETESVREPDSTVHTEVDSFDALGVVNGKYVVITYGSGQTGYVPLGEIAEKVPALELSQIASADDWSDLSQGSSGDRVRSAQQALSDLGMLEGGVDGAFGPDTEGAVKAFQESKGLAQTGIVDACCWFMLINGKQPAQSEALEVEYPPVYKVDEKFRAIADDVQDIEALQNYLDPKWVFTYDTFEGVGKIELNNGGVILGSISEGNRAVDRLSLEAKMYVDVRRSDKNIVEVRPVIEVRSAGSQRPYIKSAILKRDYTVITLDKIYQKSSVAGMTSEEVTLLGIDEKALDVIAGDEGGEVTLRLQGMHSDYDLDLTSKTELIKEFLTQGMNSSETQLQTGSEG